ncbi:MULTISPECIES: acyl-CoA dehydrogenase family protein [Nocardia]|uniref:acyl-CoA dehydrogenase family protein n=1 Tax=Nocardia TaxID=1817 RepID=UPI0007E9ABC6|nr:MULTISPECIES: acyl-CoA dehydrogenase family protein [Nocardia]MBF6277472.1 acyl-CoA dehydrogenase family protein [Nocardia nova]OBA53488.1 acyl-CoA dehydrogenase [Nocardia sp. 852002-51101_SCH5132738]OBB48007.1 acyl-CoA dehydrogenase [Nocardia sp. 852002-51244_SCH5132740]OBF66756.1 acyl-CoA dehydrogenase [Mycobacterium sp. 852002-51759_SCH5129042]
MKTDLFESDHELFGQTVRAFVERHVTPKMEKWDADRLIDRDTWRAAGGQGLLGLAVPAEFGGAGETDYRFRVVIQTEIARVGASALQSGFSTNDDIVLNYLLRHANSEQRSRWLPGFVTGETIGAIAMTEPGAGSDLRSAQTTAVREGDEWVINGSKTFITSGMLADLVIVFAVTDRDAGSRGFSLFVVEDGTPGFTRGRKLDKVGLHAQDTAELFFDNVRVPAANLLGDVGGGFGYLMQSLPLERLGIGIAAQVSAEAVLDWTLDYVKQRRAFGQRIGEFQGLGFTLAELQTATEVSRAYIDRCVREYNDGTLSAVDAAKAKLWATELQGKVIDAGVQLHGGYGYMMEYPVAKAYIDARIQRIYGGTNEIMKEIIHRDLLRS